MQCSEIKKLLSEYIDGALDEKTKAAVDSHLSKCRSCQQELSLLKAYLLEVKSLGQVKAPSDFLDKVHQRLNRRFEFERMMRKVFVPVKIKVPLELAGVLATVVLVMFVYSNLIQPQKGDMYFPIVSKRVDIAKGKEEKIAPKDKQELINLAISPQEKYLGATYDKDRVSKSYFKGTDSGYEYKSAYVPEGQVIVGSSAPAQGVALVSDLKMSLAELTSLLEFLEGKVLLVEYEEDTKQPKFVTIEIPVKNYEQFLEKVGTIGKLTQPSPYIDVEAEEPISMRIRLIPAN